MLSSAKRFSRGSVVAPRGTRLLFSKQDKDVVSKKETALENMVIPKDLKVEMEKERQKIFEHVVSLDPPGVRNGLKYIRRKSHIPHLLHNVVGLTFTQILPKDAATVRKRVSYNKEIKLNRQGVSTVNGRRKPMFKNVRETFEIYEQIYKAAGTQYEVDSQDDPYVPGQLTKVDQARTKRVEIDSYKTYVADIIQRTQAADVEQYDIENMEEASFRRGVDIVNTQSEFEHSVDGLKSTPVDTVLKTETSLYTKSSPIYTSGETNYFIKTLEERLKSAADSDDALESKEPLPSISEARDNISTSHEKVVTLEVGHSDKEILEMMEMSFRDTIPPDMLSAVKKTGQREGAKIHKLIREVRADRSSDLESVANEEVKRGVSSSVVSPIAEHPDAKNAVFTGSVSDPSEASLEAIEDAIFRPCRVLLKQISYEKPSVYFNSPEFSKFIHDFGVATYTYYETLQSATVELPADVKDKLSGFLNRLNEACLTLSPIDCAKLYAMDRAFLEKCFITSRVATERRNISLGMKRTAKKSNKKAVGSLSTEEQKIHDEFVDTLDREHVEYKDK